jgi:surface polysaccharide O-acyltransferase-like enzyme
MAEKTPDTRNRYVDFLRAVSILAVVSGHWLIAAPYVSDGKPHLGHMLGIDPRTQWLTFLFQVMPVFFIVGGYSNSASWEAARRSDLGYAHWLYARLRRLIGPVLPLLLAWVVLASVARRYDASPELIRLASQASLVPTWFLAVYMLVVLLVPATRAAWRRFGIASFWLLALAAVAVDLARFAGGWTWVGWTNYLFVWLAVHQIGYLWRDGRLAGAARALPWFVGGSLALVVLLGRFSYPLSMVGVPDEKVSNTLPPSLAMLALGAAQAGLLLSLEGPVRRWLRRSVPWTATVLVNGMIMTVYLWHLTVMILVIGLAVKLGGVGLTLAPGSAAWWSTRVIWMLLLAVALFPFLAVFGRFERPRITGAERLPGVWRLVAGTLIVCAGLALLALAGIRVWVILAPFAGAALAGLLPLVPRKEA